MPEDARWGASTQRAVQNFPVSGRPIDSRLIVALARIKGQAASVNAALRSVPAVDRATGDAVAAAAGEIVAGRWHDQFPVDVFQTGSGTSSNMNMNEVLASLAGERLGAPVHPNDQVNASQSSNDVFPSAIRMAVAGALVEDLGPAARALAAQLRRQARRHRGTVKAGRTHLMDAAPVTLGQELAGYATQVEQATARVEAGLPELCALPLGGTAVGTGLNAPPGFARRVVAGLAAETGLPLTEAADHFAVQGAQDALVATSGQVRVLAVALTRIANDLRWMGSGPATGLAEVRLPALQPGSSIMPGKVNPVICEVVAQVAVQVVGNDAAVAFAGSQGAFELNVHLPVLARNLLESVDLLAAACRLLADLVVAGLEVDVERCRRLAESSPAIATALVPALGYSVTAAVVHDALASGRTIREEVLARGLLGADVLDRVLDVDAMTRGGVVS